jgi:hypothetical protein
MKNTMCSVPGCDRGGQLRQGWCNTHYKRWSKTGDVGTAAPGRGGTTGVCAVEDCASPSRTVGAVYCEMHYSRQHRTGTLDVTPRPICSVPGCNKTEQDSGMCSMHAIRMQRTGNPHEVIHQRDRALPRGPANPRWSGDNVTYAGIHLRLKATKGRAAGQRCVDCGNAAKHWSYDHTDPSERVCELGAYSTDLDHYAPRCVPCHKTFDLALLGGAA